MSPLALPPSIPFPLPLRRTAFSSYHPSETTLDRLYHSLQSPLNAEYKKEYIDIMKEKLPLLKPSLNTTAILRGTDDNLDDYMLQINQASLTIPKKISIEEYAKHYKEMKKATILHCWNILGWRVSSILATEKIWKIHPNSPYR